MRLIYKYTFSYYIELFLLRKVNFINVLYNSGTKDRSSLTYVVT